MSKANFDKIKDIYRDSFEKYGDNTNALLTPKGRQALRFNVVLEHMKENASILDFGCGLGYLFQFLNERKIDSFSYHGVDLSNEFISACNKKFMQNNCKFDVIDPDEELENTYDIVFCSGVFNIKYSKSFEIHLEYVFNRLSNLFQNTNSVLICDFLSPNVDFQQDESFHIDLSRLIEFCQTKLTRKWQIRHDILPYECMLIAYSDDAINNVNNTYQED